MKKYTSDTQHTIDNNEIIFRDVTEVFALQKRRHSLRILTSASALDEFRPYLIENLFLSVLISSEVLTTGLALSHCSRYFEH